MKPVTKEYNGYTFTTDAARLNVPAIHRWLTEESYWAKGVTLKTVQSSVEHSFCYGILKDGEQVGFARLITDYTTFAYLADVFITAAHRGRGLSKILMQFILDTDWVMQLRKVLLATTDAHGLYKQFGFEPLKRPEKMMELVLDPIVHK